jgi:hypothetical protein
VNDAVVGIDVSKKTLDVSYAQGQRKVTAQPTPCRDCPLIGGS